AGGQVPDTRVVSGARQEPAVGAEVSTLPDGPRAGDPPQGLPRVGVEQEPARYQPAAVAAEVRRPDVQGPRGRYRVDVPQTNGEARLRGQGHQRLTIRAEGGPWGGPGERHQELARLGVPKGDVGGRPRGEPAPGRAEPYPSGCRVGIRDFRAA